MSEMTAVDFIRAELWLEKCGVQKGFGKLGQDAIAKATGNQPS